MREGFGIGCDLAFADLHLSPLQRLCLDQLCVALRPVGDGTIAITAETNC